MADADRVEAPGHPGIAPRWTSSDKAGVGKAISPLSRVWFTFSHGVLNEVYYPRVDQACLRDFGFMVTGGAGFFAEEKRDCSNAVDWMEDGVPAFRLTNLHRGGRFRLTKHLLTDPRRDVVLQRVHLQPLHGERLRLFALLSPHLVNRGANNSAWLGEYKGQQMLFAEGAGTAIALAADCPWIARTVGFVGQSDGWQDVRRNGRLTETYDHATDGNVAMCGELDLPESGTARLALGFGRTWAEAAYRARSTLQDDMAHIEESYREAWREWQAGLRPLDRRPRAVAHNTYRVSAAVMRCHDSPSFPGGLIASLSIPWGASKGDDDLGGYHLVWPRDLCLTAGGLLACDAHEDAVQVLDYLRAIQEEDGHWPQNAWLDGTPYWRGLQLDECAFPMLLTEMCLRLGALRSDRLAEYWPMVRSAAGFVVRTGPVTGQDRWEENGGFTPFTLAVAIASLLAAADLADRSGEPGMGSFLRDTADSWNSQIESWLWAEGTPLARECGVPGYYVRATADRSPLAGADMNATVPVKNRDSAHGSMPAWAMVSPDALALVRFGLRAADDPRILATIKVLDHVVRQDLPAGPYFHRYNGDGYGEKPDGSPFDGAGQGRLWPLLTGERAHVALAAGDLAGAEAMLATLEASASSGFMLPEQIWDAADIPERELVLGCPSGSAMPLVWAHSEHVKLIRSLADGAVFDMPPQARRRYAEGNTPARVQPWRPTHRPAHMRRGLALRVELPRAAVVRWTADGWQSFRDAPTQDTGLGVHAAELPTARLGAGTGIVFTWREDAAGTWAGENVTVDVVN